eukprot:14945400-Heterocapsa_arctica.AAC.1
MIHNYKKFHEQFGKCLDPGVHKDFINWTKMAKHLRWHTVKSGDKQISLKEYVDCIKKGQNNIYYIKPRCTPFDFYESMKKHVNIK